MSKRVAFERGGIDDAVVSRQSSIDLEPGDLDRFTTLLEDNDLNPRVNGEAADSWYGRVNAILERKNKRVRTKSPLSAPPEELAPATEALIDRAMAAPAMPLAEMKSALRKPRIENEPTINEAGQAITEEGCTKLIADKLAAKAWHRVLGDTIRDPIRPGLSPTNPVLEFIVPAWEQTWGFTKEFKLAGYYHWSACAQNGWHPFELPGGKKGWGRPLTDAAELMRYREVKEFDTPTPHPSGTGYVWRGTHYRDGDAWGPRGQMGPKYGSSFCGD